MHITTKTAVIAHLQDVCYLLNALEDKSLDELHVLAATEEALRYIKDIKTEGE